MGVNLIPNDLWKSAMEYLNNFDPSTLTSLISEHARFLEGARLRVFFILGQGARLFGVLAY